MYVGADSTLTSVLLVALMLDSCMTLSRLLFMFRRSVPPAQMVTVLPRPGISIPRACARFFWI
jgi:hypothetical protein